MDNKIDETRIGIVGLGYVGLPVALAFAARYPNTVGFDINPQKVDELRRGIDRTREITSERLKKSSIKFTADESALAGVNFFVVCVPTPVDENRRPDLSPLISASQLVGRVIRQGATVVFESTVYPGVTEEICGPEIARVSGLQAGVDFKLGYSPERINPGDHEHTLERIIKVVSGEDSQTLERIAQVYGSIIDAGVYRAASIKAAEAAKVIENTQRDLNIALMNELSLIFDLMGIRTRDVLDAAGTKWNFLRFSPGLVGGHCIGVDPYYLTEKAERLGYHPEIILAGRRINDGMGGYVARKLVQLLSQRRVPLTEARIGVCGLTFKENVSDLRNSRVCDIIEELSQFGIQALVHDPCAMADEAEHEYGVSLNSWENFYELDAIVLAVPHREYLANNSQQILNAVKPDGIVIDVKSVIDPATVGNRYYWSL